MFISIHDIILSKSFSVINVFFTLDFIETKQRSFTEMKEKHEYVRRKLVHSSPYLKAQLTEKAGLKYAPDLRFYPYDPAGGPIQVLVLKT
jgi:ribosome-binding factor A